MPKLDRLCRFVQQPSITRRLRRLWVVPILICGLVSQLQAQQVNTGIEKPAEDGSTLSLRLMAESTTALAEEAIAKGDPTRGALLFPQPSLGCARCHSDVGQDRLGPDLNQLRRDYSDAYLVEALLNPSKVVLEGYSVTRVLSEDGRTYAGRLIAADDDRVVLRLNTEGRERISLDRSEVLRMETSQTSLMPDGLADQLQNKQQFLDLLRYLMQLRDTQEINAQTTTRSELTAAQRGLLLLDRFQCGNCHPNDLATQWDFPSREAPALQHIVGKLSPAYLERFLVNPDREKPGTDMPNMLLHLNRQERQRVATQLTHYLVAEAEGQFQPTKLDPESAARGRETYHSIGCVVCHAEHEAIGLAVRTDDVPLGPLAYSLEGLTQFLEDPVKCRPSGRMPSLNLSHWEAIDLANYLLSRVEPVETSSLAVNSELVSLGKAQYQQLGCAVCHEPSQSNLESTFAKAAPLSQLNLALGCLSEELQPESTNPKLQLDEAQRTDVRNAILTFREDAKLTTEQHIQLAMATFRCSNCHSRKGYGGVTEEKNDYFQTSDPNLGPQGRIPPDLSYAGAKLNRKWMREVLVSGKAIRPYVNTRMPQFGTENVAHFVDKFQEQDELPAVEFPEIRGREAQKTMRDAGFDLVSNNGLNCIACHTFQQKPALTMPAVDLTEMFERLQPDWFYHYMREPKRFHAGTVMPAFWPDGRATRTDILDGDAHQQIAAIWEWMKEGRQARTPRGLIRKPLRLLATDETVMLRRSYPGIGKRGIGVGFPENVNLAFDAEQMRMGMIWRGEFADTSGVWRSQGHGRVNPLSREQIHFSPGPEIDLQDAPWIPDDGRPPKHQFEGYELDADRRPEFLYRAHGVSVQDYTVGKTDASGNENDYLLRTLTLTSESTRQDLVFRMAPKDLPIKEMNDAFVLGDAKLTIQILPPWKASLRKSASGDAIEVPLNLRASVPVEVRVEYRWGGESND